MRIVNCQTRPMRGRHLGPSRRIHRPRQRASVLAVMVLLTIPTLPTAFVMATEPGRAVAASPTSNQLQPKAEVIDGVPLIPTTASQRDECQKFANHLRRPIPCPGLLPDPIPVSPTSAGALCPHEYGGFGEGSCGPAAIALNRNLFELSQSNFQVPPGYVGVTIEQSNGATVPETSISGGPLGHFVFMTGTDLHYVMTHSRGGNIAPVPPYCSRLDALGVRVQGRSASLYQCGSSQSLTQIELISGHTLLVWKDAGITCEVSFHGHSQVNVDLDVAIANATVLVAPRKR